MATKSLCQAPMLVAPVQEESNSGPQLGVTGCLNKIRFTLKIQHSSCAIVRHRDHLSILALHWVVLALEAIEVPGYVML